MPRPPTGPFAVVFAAVTLAGTASASDHTLRLDLRGLDLSTAAGADLAAARLARALDDHCGPLDLPQPLSLARERTACRAAMTEKASEAIALARARADSASALAEQARVTPDAARM